MRRLRIKHIDRADAAVAVVFLAEKQRLTALICGELRAGQQIKVPSAAAAPSRRR